MTMLLLLEHHARLSIANATGVQLKVRVSLRSLLMQVVPVIFPTAVRP
jgi:hypothetical protein